jgi:sensor histidine kinase regulating citrate/malate metabolism
VRSIQWRITFFFTLIVVVVMAILGVFLTDTVRDIQIDNMRRNLKNQALMVRETVLLSLADSAVHINLESAIYRIENRRQRITVIDSTGR